MDLTKLKKKRAAQKAVISRHLQKLEDSTDDDVQFLTIVHSLQTKVRTLEECNENIIYQTDEDDLEIEMVETEDYMLDLKVRIRSLEAQQRKHAAADVIPPPLLNPLDVTQGEPPRNNSNSVNTAGRSEDTSGNTNNGTSGENVSSISINSSQSSHFHKLPKLTLPIFTGNILEWQTFWDSFESSVHNNVLLSDVQKFSYLRSLLKEDAARVIQGFPLTHSNYAQAVDLLKERFGQEHKIVNAYMQNLLELSRPTSNIHSLRNFQEKMESYIRGLQSLGQGQESYGNLLVPVILEKLPAEIKRNMTRNHGNSHWQLPDLRQALKNEITILESGQPTHTPEVHDATATFFTDTRSHPKGTHRQQTTNEKRPERPRCHFCSDHHLANDCRKVTNTVERKKIVKEKKLCFNCLGSHQVATCRSNRRCRICQRKHHTSICDNNAQPLSQQSNLNVTAPSFTPAPTCRDQATSGSSDQSAILHFTTQSRPNVLLKTAVSKVTSGNLYTDVNILFDEGAQRSFVTEELAERLKLKRTGREVVQLAAFGSSSKKVSHFDTATVYLLADTRERIAIDVLIVPTIAVPLRNVQRIASALPYLRGLKLAHPVTEEDTFNISLLIGADKYWEVVGNRVIRGNGPTAVQSKIGYLLSGPLPVNTTDTATEYILNVITSQPDTYNLERFWKLESLGIQPEKDDETTSEYLATYQRNCIEFKEGRYSAQLPWKRDHPALPDNYNISLKRTESTIRRLRQDTNMLQMYGKIISEQEKRGFIERVADDNTDNRIHYIPHHGVKKDSVTTPVRIVYDCSCRQNKDSPSLNDCLESTPPELNDLSHILVRFRLHRFAVCTDIEKAFLQVQLNERDRDVTRFLWLSDSNNPDSSLITYRFKSVLFGATCSPFILQATLMKHLDYYNNIWVSEILKKDLYVDNVISSFQDEDTVVSYFRDARDLMSSAGFNLRSWNSNSCRLRTLAEADDVLDSDEITKILGMRWDAVTDHIFLTQKTIPTFNPMTKRTILQETAKLYDPLGLFIPVTIRAKILLQDIWKQKHDWDVPLPETIQIQWQGIAEDINSSITTRFSRYYFGGADVENTSGIAGDQPKIAEDNISLHVFCDASLRAYGSVVYIVRGKQSTLVMARSRVHHLNN